MLCPLTPTAGAIARRWNLPVTGVQTMLVESGTEVFEERCMRKYVDAFIKLPVARGYDVLSFNVHANDVGCAINKCNVHIVITTAYDWDALQTNMLSISTFGTRTLAPRVKVRALAAQSPEFWLFKDDCSAYKGHEACKHDHMFMSMKALVHRRGDYHLPTLRSGNMGLYLKWCIIGVHLVIRARAALNDGKATQRCATQLRKARPPSLRDLLAAMGTNVWFTADTKLRAVVHVAGSPPSEVSYAIGKRLKMTPLRQKPRTARGTHMDLRTKKK